MQGYEAKNEPLIGRERTVPVGELNLWAEDFGAPGSPVVLLVMGAQAQGVQWNDGMLRRLVDGGRRVIRYDHRDVGRSSTVDFAAHPYTVADMASDALAVLDAFGVGRAHWVGASLGGVIAQRVALTHPHRVLTLTSLSSQPLGTNTVATVQRALTGAALRRGGVPHDGDPGVRADTRCAVRAQPHPRRRRHGGIHHRGPGGRHSAHAGTARH
ncbi:hypothetical protein GCM10009730_62280 [Streptomyces albidochromogenes]|uniref:alpha/beta fold hydrolase n=1 Tax=Streptomyces albidochromogenes TaxID=329524 RepID=UPI001FCB4FF8|nr:alpha/beta fold hydrolase [Streptomyces albidochromogenes]